MFARRVNGGGHRRADEFSIISASLTRHYYVCERQWTVAATVLGTKTMARNKRVRLSDDEKAILNDIRERHFGGDETPYGYVVAELCRFYESETRGSNVQL